MTNMKLIIRTAGIVLMLLTVSMAHATSVAVTTNGGDRDTYIDRWRGRNIDKVCRQLSMLGIRDCKKITTKAALEMAIQELVERLNCGDTLVLYFNGHGSEDRGFVFDKEGHRSANRYVQPAEILQWLQGLACCVNVYIGWHACYSGRFTEELSADPHVKVAVSSASPSKPSHRGVLRRPGLEDFVSPLNWADGFADGLQAGGSLIDIFQRAARRAKAKAEETDGNKTDSYEDDPQDFKRGHIESVTRTPTGLSVLLKAGRDTVRVFIPNNGKTGVKGLEREELQYCMNIDVSGEAQFDRNGRFIATNVKVTHLGGKFHVLSVVNRAQKKVQVVYTEPAGIKNTIGIVVMDPLPPDVQFCKWYQFHGAVNGKIIISNPDSLRAAAPDHYEWKGHIQEVDPATGELVMKLSDPSPLRGNVVRVKPQPGQNIPNNIVACMNISFSGMPDAVDKVTLENPNTIGVPVENIRAHVEGIDPATGDIKVTIMGLPERRDGAVVTAKPLQGENLDGLEACKTILFQGKVYGDEIRDASSIQIVN